MFKARFMPSWGKQPLGPARPSQAESSSQQHRSSGFTSVNGTQRSLAGQGVSFGGKVGSGGKGLGKGIGMKRHR